MINEPTKLHLEPFQGIESLTKNWYKHIEILGSGANALTALVISTSDAHRGTLFAMKIFKRLGQVKRRLRFQAETEFLQNCVHPSIMRIFDTGLYTYGWEESKSEYPFIVAEYLPKTLGNVIQDSNSSLPEKVSYMMQLLSALDYLHGLKSPVLHRDIKPSNIFVKGNSCVLGDFGLLKVLGKDEPSDSKFYHDSLDGRIPWIYRSPDLVKYARGKSDLTTKSDVYQAGLVACELFTGHLPIATPRKMLDDVEFTHIPKIHGAFGPRIASLIKIMLSENPNDRPTAHSLLRTWENIFWDAVKKTHELDGHAFRTRV